MQARISSILIVAALLTLGLMIPFTAAQEPPSDPVTAELRAAEAFLDILPLPAAGACSAGKQPGIPEDVLYFWDFEGSNGGFVGSLDWIWGTYAWSGTTCDSSNYPPPAAYSGTGMWGTRLNDCYQNRGNNTGYGTCANGNPADDSILSFSVDLTAVTGPVEMSWWEWYDLFSNWDWGEVYVNGSVVFQHCEASFVQPTAWVQQIVDLTPYIGGVANVQIHMMASSVVNHSGWFIDDVSVYTVAADPDIEVTAPPLEAVLCPEQTATLELTICNLGGQPLDWALTEVLTAKLSGFTAAPSAAGTRPVELKLDAAPGPGGSVPAGLLAPDAPVALALDDGSSENYIGLNDGTYGFQFLWLNRFTPNPADFPFSLNQISVVLGATGVTVGDPIDLVVYQDTDSDGDPGNAVWLATYPVTVQYNDGVTWNDYPLATPLALAGPGDVLIGVINRYQVSGVDPSDFPAALDQGATQQRSWVGAWSADPPVPPVLPPDAGGLWGLIDAYFPGNWMVRGYGETQASDIPWLTEVPTNGVLMPSECVTVEVTFDSHSMAPGDYYGSLVIHSNDPDEPQITLPVTMTVLDCACRLEGYVTDVETGSVDPPCTRALVHVEPGNLDIPADLDGYYVTTLAAGTYTVTATAPGYSVETAVVSVTTGVTTTQDFALRRPVVDVDPLTLVVDLADGQSATLPLTVASLGHLGLSWSLEEQLPPAHLADLPWVSADPVSGTIPPQNHTDVDVTFTCFEIGDYEGTLLFTTNDPCAYHVPVSLALHCRSVYYVYLPIALRNP